MVNYYGNFYTRKSGRHAKRGRSAHNVAGKTPRNNHINWVHLVPPAPNASKNLRRAVKPKYTKDTKAKKMSKKFGGTVLAGIGGAVYAAYNKVKHLVPWSRRHKYILKRFHDDL